jgi:hypothetical protein
MARRQVSEKSGTRVECRKVKGARELITTDCGLGESPRELLARGVPLRGAIVRFQPAEGAHPDWVRQTREELLSLGACAVRTMPARGKAVAVPEREARKVEATDPRSVCLAMVRRANTTDAAALKVAVEEALASAGL